MSTEVTTIVTSGPVDVAIAAWLHEKTQRSNSAKTLKAYKDTIKAFRDALRHLGLDLDSVEEKEERQAVALTAQQYASWSSLGKQVSTATFNQRLAILSSFYEYAKRHELLEHNPIDRIKRAKVQAYAEAQPLDLQEAVSGLQRIDRATLSGARDYALLALLLETGHRLSVVQRLTWGDVKVSQDEKGKGEKVKVTFKHGKGGKTMIIKLSRPTGAALLSWLRKYHGRALGKLENKTPLWVSLAKGPSYGLPLGIQAIADICQKHMGTSKVHTMRHTFAHTMEKAGASVSEIQARLGHESLATTGRYLVQLKQAENRHAETLAGMFGIE